MSSDGHDGSSTSPLVPVTHNIFVLSQASRMDLGVSISVCQ